MIRLLALMVFLFAAPAMADCHILAAYIDPVETDVRYYNFAEHGVPSATEGNENRWTAPLDMNAHSLRVVVDVAPSAGTWTIHVRDDTNDTGITCTITGGATTCEDLSNTATIAKGSRVTIGATGSSSPTAAAEMWMSFCVEEL